jgi:alpha-L-arabinofuranosidase
MNRIQINPQRIVAGVERHLFGSFVEHLDRCVYGGIYDPGSPLSDERGFRLDVLDAVRRLRPSIVRYPGGNFVSGYRWLDGVGPREQRPTRRDLAWHVLESNHFGTNEFIEWCRAVNTEPYMVVNCGDGDMREARDWVEYCNSAEPTAMAKLRQSHGYDAPHGVKIWGIGNEVDGPWQIGYKTPQEYARAVTEFGKVMRWADPTIKLVAHGVSHWDAKDFVERGQILLEQAAGQIDYLAVHWYVDNDHDDYWRFMAHSELFEERLRAYSGLIHAVRAERKIKKPIWIAADEYNVWHFKPEKIGEHDVVMFNVEDALVVAAQLNAFIRHADMVKMANFAQLVNLLAPIVTTPEAMLLQSSFYVFEMFATLAGAHSIDVYWDGDTFSAGDHEALRMLDVTATLSADQRTATVFVVNRAQQPIEAELKLMDGRAAGEIVLHSLTGPDIKAMNRLDNPDVVKTAVTRQAVDGNILTLPLAAHSVTAVVIPLI